MTTGEIIEFSKITQYFKKIIILYKSKNLLLIGFSVKINTNQKPLKLQKCKV